MAKLIYSAICSLDGYTADERGDFDWAAPGEEVFAAVNDLQRTVGTYLYGRRMYEMMLYWETAGDDSPVTRDFARLWRAADKIVYSRTLDAPSSARTRIERTFDPGAVRALKASAPRDLTIAGADLAGVAAAAGLVDEYHLFLVPVLIGGGHRALADGVRRPLELLDEHRFPGGFVRLRYRVTA
ncbi:dihydrofolate reductase family protein [Amycolatopsis sp. NPDC051903]|uniref:dihydrofolate reductase family protein n=1 Tax=Amycolatopsis sp. NPDC051903 TaxID=3363936 RepID=UPI003789EC36